jgi:hypothetical protein
MYLPFEFNLSAQISMKSKFLSTLLLASLCLLFSCNKNEIADIDDPAQAPDISLVPDRFDQKLLLEVFTSSFCGVCPENDLLRDSLATENPGRVFPVSIHIDDLLIDASSQNPGSMINFMDSLFNPTGIYPSGTINRKISGTSDLSPTNWRFNLNSSLGTIPKCGLAIDAKSLNGNTLKVVVHTGFSSTMTGEYRLHAYLVRSLFMSPDTAYAQLNDLDSLGATPDSNSTFYHAGTQLINYGYKHVLVKVINDNGPAGDIIPAGSMFRSNDFVKTFTVDLTGINSNGLTIVAFVDKYGTDGTSHRIENVQRVNVGEVKDWN